VDRKSLSEWLGVGGVIASLVFVGLQVRQSAEAMRAATVLQLKDNWVQFNMAQIDNPEVTRAFEVVDSLGWENADARSRHVVTALTRGLLHMWANTYYHYRNGTLDADQWPPVLRDIEFESSNSSLWEVWTEWGHAFDDPFRVLMDSVKAANSGGSG